VASAVECVLDDGELALPTDELRAGLVRDVDAEARAGSQRFPDRDRGRLSLASTALASR